MTLAISVGLLIGLPAFAQWRGFPTWTLFAAAGLAFAALALPASLQLWALQRPLANEETAFVDTYYVISGHFGSWSHAAALVMLALLHLTQIRLAHVPAPHLLLGLFWGLHLSLVFGLVLPRLIFEIAQPRRYIDYPDVAALMVTATSVLAFAGTIALLLIVGLLLLSAVQQFRRG